MPLILPGNVASAVAGAYEVANSCRFNDDDSAAMTFTMSSGGSQTIFTKSFWIKRARLGATQYLFDNSGETDILINFNSSDQMNFNIYASGAYSLDLKTNQLFRDVSAWYHIVLAVDYTNGTQAHRARVYVNGTEITSWDTEVRPGNNSTTFDTYNSDKTHYIGSNASSGNFFDGYLAEVVHIDGTQYAASDFGEFDEDSPTIWKPKDVSGLTFGTKGYYLDFEASDNLGNDANGGTDWGETNIAAADQATDTPTLNYPTLNPLMGVHANLTFAEGNLNMIIADTAYRGVPATLGAQNGKWYAEFKAVSGFSAVDMSAGIYRTDNTYGQSTALGNYTTGTTWSYGATGNVRNANGNTDTGEATFTDDDIIQVAMDLDNNKLYFGKNNTYINSGDPTTGATGTGAYAITAGDFYHFAINTYKDSNGAGLWSANFGSPAYANSSDAADANGYGAFEFAPPSGYYAMNSANLAEFG